MDHVRCKTGQKGREIGDQLVEVELALIEQVEPARPQQHLVGRPADRLERGARPTGPVGPVDASQEQRWRSRRPKRRGEVAGEQLRTAGV